MNKLLTGRCVLVVEDEMLILMMIEDMLSDPRAEAEANYFAAQMETTIAA